MIVIYWRNLALLGGPQTHSGCLLLGPVLPLKTRRTVSLQDSKPGMGLDSVLNSGSRYTFVWAEAWLSGGISLYLHLQLAL